MPTSDVTESASSTVVEILAKLETDPKTGLNAAQLQERLKKYGPNALPEEKKSALSVFLPYFWGPIPWMIEAAALMALIVRDWGDFTIITALLLFNALLGFWEEHEASNALHQHRPIGAYRRIAASHQKIGRGGVLRLRR